MEQFIGELPAGRLVRNRLPDQAADRGEIWRVMEVTGERYVEALARTIKHVSDDLSTALIEGDKDRVIAGSVELFELLSITLDEADVDIVNDVSYLSFAAANAAGDYFEPGIYRMEEQQNGRTA